MDKQIPKILTEQTDAPLPEDIPYGFAKYINFKDLRNGGISSIKTCQDSILGRTVACKTLLSDFKDIETENKRFIREARITALLQHPNTPGVYDFGRTHNGDLFFTMKYVEGETLGFIITCLARHDKAKEKKFTLNKLLKIIIQAGYGLDYAHQRGVIHRDIKPANILIGEYGEVSLIDWGIAKVWDAPLKDDIVNQIARSSKDLELTQMGPQPGTPLYMSPEQIRGDEIDERTDIYSLGAILYEMLTMKTIFKAHSMHELLLKVKTDDAMTPSKMAPERYIPRRVEEICMKAISKNREDRYSKIIDFINDIRDFSNQASLAYI